MELLAKEQIIVGNKLIAEFEKLEIHNTLSLAKTPIKAYEWHCNLYSEMELKYHKSWDWLMPVVEKIEDLYDGEYFFDICGRRSRISIMVNHNIEDT